LDQTTFIDDIPLMKRLLDALPSTPSKTGGKKEKKKTTTLLSSSVHSIIQHGKHGKRSLTIWGNDQTHTRTDVDARSLALPSSINWQMSGQQQEKKKKEKRAKGVETQL
jgi:hypothetical protein